MLFRSEKKASSIVKEEVHKEHHKQEAEKDKQEKDNNLSLNMSETKELIVDYRKRRAKHTPIHIDGAIVELVESFQFLVFKSLRT